VVVALKGGGRTDPAVEGKVKDMLGLGVVEMEKRTEKRWLLGNV
jgi:hypothetical protein